MSEPQTKVRFEPRDISIRGVLIAGFGVLLGMIVIVLLMHLLFSYMRSAKARQSPPASPLARRIDQLPPQPRLQESPAQDYQAMRFDADWKLHHYQWIDKQKGSVTMPIDRAMALIAQRGIPPSSEPPSQFYRPQEGDRLTGFGERQAPQP
jgi:heme/copper-type cytochrome/quinol oxidase subunit 1